MFCDLAWAINVSGPFLMRLWLINHHCHQQKGQLIWLCSCHGNIGVPTYSGENWWGNVIDPILVVLCEYFDEWRVPGSWLPAQMFKMIHSWVICKWAMADPCAHVQLISLPLGCVSVLVVRFVRCWKEYQTKEYSQN